MRFLERSVEFIFVSVLPTINTALVTIVRPVSPSRPASEAQVHSGLRSYLSPPGAHIRGPGQVRREWGLTGRSQRRRPALWDLEPSWSRQTTGGGRSPTLAPRPRLAQHTAASSERASRPHRRVSGPESAAPPSAPHHRPDTTPHLRPRSTPHRSEPRPASP